MKLLPKELQLPGNTVLIIYYTQFQHFILFSEREEFWKVLCVTCGIQANLLCALHQEIYSHESNHWHM